MPAIEYFMVVSADGQEIINICHLLSAAQKCAAENKGLIKRIVGGKVTPL